MMPPRMILCSELLERIPFVDKFNELTSVTLLQRLPGASTLVVMLLAGLQGADAQQPDAPCAPSSYSLEHFEPCPVAKRRWWQWWAPKAEVDNYRTKFPHCTRNGECPLPVCPPLHEPNFGYYTPCWRQLQIPQRCPTNCDFQSAWTPASPDMSTGLAQPQYPPQLLPSPRPVRDTEPANSLPITTPDQ